jgi:hypothetical protein
MGISPEELSSLSDKANAAFRQVAAKVIERAKQTGTPVVVWEDGQVKELPPQQLEQQVAASDPKSKASQSRQFGLGKGKLTIVNDDDLPDDFLSTVE